MSEPQEIDPTDPLRARDVPAESHAEADLPTSPWLPSADTPPAIAPGDVLSNRYRVDRFLARGGMGDVYHAFDLELEIPVALKTIRPDVASNPDALRYFKREVLVARSITSQCLSNLRLGSG